MKSATTANATTATPREITTTVPALIDAIRVAGQPSRVLHGEFEVPGILEPNPLYLTPLDLVLTIEHPSGNGGSETVRYRLRLREAGEPREMTFDELTAWLTITPRHYCFSLQGAPGAASEALFNPGEAFKHLPDHILRETGAEVLES